MTVTTDRSHAWHHRHQPPPLENLRRVGAADWDVFVASSGQITPAIWRKLRDHVLATVPADAMPRVLDFGCGVGRVALQLRAERGLPTHACDIDASAVSYLRSQLPEVDIRVTGFEPPLPYASDFFDGIYSVSIWTHLSLDHQRTWLEEMARILKPGGHALITTSGTQALRVRHQRRDAGWERCSIEDLRREGILYIAYERAGVDPDRYPGVTASYGLTAHDPGWIRENWSDVFEVLAIHERAIGNVQDLCILRKRP